MRLLLDIERPIVAFLFECAKIPVDLNTLLVRAMADGGMGSLEIAPFNVDRKLGSVAADCHFFDRDGAPVLVALNLDEKGLPFEIDIWRVDFGATLEWPQSGAILAGKPNHTFQPTPSARLN